MGGGTLVVDGGSLNVTTSLSTNRIMSLADLTITGTGALDVPGGIYAPTCTVEAAWGGARLFHSRGALTLNGPADALKTVLVTGGELAMNGVVSTVPELRVGAGATLAVGEDASLRVCTMDGAGAYAGPGTLVLDNPHEGRCDAALGDGLVVRKTGTLDWFFYGALDGATVNCETGRVYVAGGAREGSFGLSGRVVFLGASVAGVLTVTEDLETTGLVFGADGTLTLADGAALRETGDLDVGNLSIMVQGARNASDPVLVQAGGALAGRPRITFTEAGFIAYFDEALNAWCARRTGFAIYVR